jgi:hypothetical protein
MSARPKYDYTAVCNAVESVVTARKGRRFDKKQILAEVAVSVPHLMKNSYDQGLAAATICGMIRGANNPVLVGNEASLDNIYFRDSSNGTTRQPTPAPTTSAPAPSNETALRETIDRLKNERDTAIKQKNDASIAAQSALAKANDRIRDLANSGSGRILEVRLIDDSSGKVVKKLKETFHPQFEKVMKLARARMNMYLFGPTGSGKSHLAHQVAVALNLDFYFVSCTTGMSENTLTGRLAPVGKAGTFEYIIGEFVKAYEKGGVFLMDEMDAADDNVLLVINAALANGKMNVPNRYKNPVAVRHPDFIFIGAGNTVGTGASRLHGSRSKLDAASRDRMLVGQVFIGYDRTVEDDLCPGATRPVKQKYKAVSVGASLHASSKMSLADILLLYREAIDAGGLERWLSSRFMRDAYKMVEGKDAKGKPYGFTMADVDEAFFLGWRADEIEKVRTYVNREAMSA